MSAIVKGTVVIKGTLLIVTAPADYWVVGEDSGTGDVGYAANTDRTSWTFYDRMPSNSAAIDGAYGKDASGNGIYLFSNSSTISINLSLSLNNFAPNPTITVSSNIASENCSWSIICIITD